MATINSSQALVLVSRQNGIVVIPATPLTRLNYFDGKFLRADDLQREQDYLRFLVHQSNQAGGPGVVHGFDVTQGEGDSVNIGEGFAIDPKGRVLLLPRSININVKELIDKSMDVERRLRKPLVRGEGDFDECDLHTDEPIVEAEGQGDFFEIVISPAEALCGEEDVFGKLCEEACATSTDRPYLMEGLTIRAVRLRLSTPLPNSRARAMTQAHLRSRVASAYFETERRRVASLISKFGLEQETWCLGADGVGGNGVAIGVFAREGTNTVFLDPWIVRRERIDSPPRRYWQWRMMMRPWDVFLAQVLQFQCQLHDLFARRPQKDNDDDETDPCGGARGVIREAATAVEDFRKLVTTASERLIALKLNPDEVMKFEGGLARLSTLNDKLFNVGQVLAEAPIDELLIRRGIIELPSAGYLPVTPGQNATINQQVRRLMGRGVDLRFCVVRPDYVAHALEEAQHLERISLLQGLDDPDNKPQVDILVPNGELIEQKQVSPGTGFEATLNLNSDLLRASVEGIALPPSRNILFTGAARVEKLATSGGAFYLSCEHSDRLTIKPADDGTVVADDPADADDPVKRIAIRPDVLGQTLGLAAPTANAGLWVSLQCINNVLRLNRGDSTNFNARAIVSAGSKTAPTLDVELNGVLQVTEEKKTTGPSEVVKGRIENAQLSYLGAQLGVSGPRKNIFVDLDVMIEFNEQGGVGVVLDHAQMSLTFFVRWNKLPRIEVTVGSRSGNKRLREPNISIADLNVQLAEAVLKENEDVLSATNTNHIQALRGLQFVAKTLSDPNFADAKARLLFPPPPKPADELLVRGTMDWVLFHRRRNKQCQVDVQPPPPPVPPRRFAFKMGAIDDEGVLRSVRESLEKNTPFRREEISFKQVNVLEFEAGLASMISRPDDVKADWSRVNPGNRILHVAIASATANDGELVANGRWQRVARAIESVSQSDGKTTSQVLPIVHAELEAPNTDGVVLFITRVSSPTVCHSVFRVQSLPNLERAVELIQKGNVADALNTDQITPLGSVLFHENTADVSDLTTLNHVKTEWDKRGGRPGIAAVVVPPQRPPHSIARLQLDQAKAIMTGIGVAPDAPFEVQTPVLPTPPVDCPVFSLILAVQERVARLLVQIDSNAIGDRFFAKTEQEVITVQFNPDGSLTAPLPEPIVKELLKVAPRLKGAELGPAGASDPLAQARVNAIVQELNKRGVNIPAAASKEVTLKLSEQGQLNLGGGQIADDLIFLIR
jgi:hypothetical protein